MTTQQPAPLPPHPKQTTLLKDDDRLTRQKTLEQLEADKKMEQFKAQLEANELKKKKILKSRVRKAFVNAARQAKQIKEAKAEAQKQHLQKQ